MCLVWDSVGSDWCGSVKKKKLKSLAMAHSFSLERRFPLLMECF